MSKKDARNGKESGNLRPVKWTEAKLRSYIRHVMKHAITQSMAMDGLLGALQSLGGFVAGSKARVSAAMLAKLGVKTVGEVASERTP